MQQIAVNSGLVKAWVVSLTLLVLASCAVRVAPSDLIGQWQMSDDAVNRLGLKVRPTFKLNLNGSLEAENLPASAHSDSHPWRQLYSGTGAWTLPASRRTQGFSSLVLDFKRKVPDESTGLTLQIEKDSAGFYVFAWLDEEGGERLIFRRQ